MACRIAAGDHSPSIVKTSQSFHDASRIAFGTNGCSRDRDRIINSPARSPALKAVLNGAHRSYVNFAPPAYPSAGAIGASLVVKCESQECGLVEAGLRGHVAPPRRPHGHHACARLHSAFHGAMDEEHLRATAHC